MARKNDQTRNIILAGLIGFAAWQLLKPKKAPPTTQNFQQMPPAPPPGTPAWQMWAQGIVNVFGSVAQLWQPGGPFYNQPISQEQAQAIEIGTGQQYNNYV